MESTPKRLVEIARIEDAFAWAKRVQWEALDPKGHRELRERADSPDQKDYKGRKVKKVRKALLVQSVLKATEDLSVCLDSPETTEFPAGLENRDRPDHLDGMDATELMASQACLDFLVHLDYLVFLVSPAYLVPKENQLSAMQEHLVKRENLVWLAFLVYLVHLDEMGSQEKKEIAVTLDYLDLEAHLAKLALLETLVLAVSDRKEIQATKVGQVYLAHLDLCQALAPKALSLGRKDCRAKRERRVRVESPESAATPAKPAYLVNLDCLE